MRNIRHINKNCNKRQGQFYEFSTHAFGDKRRTPEIHGTRLFHRTSDGANSSSLCGITASAGIWVSAVNTRMGPMDKWPCRCTSRSQHGPIILRIGPVDLELQSPQNFGCPTDGNTRKGPGGQWPCRGRSTGQDGSIELALEQIGAVPMKLQHPRNPKGRTDGDIQIRYRLRIFYFDILFQISLRFIPKCVIGSE